MKCPKGINPAPQVTAARNIRGNVIANGLSCGWQGCLLYTSVTNYRPEENEIEIIGINYDITELKETEAEPVSYTHLDVYKRQLSDYIIDIRLGFASRLLVDSTMSIAEICYECGFNNLSNFNRIFKKKKACSCLLYTSRCV